MPFAAPGQSIVWKGGRRVVVSTGSAISAAAWNPADKSANVTLTNTNRTATGPGALGNVRAITSRSTGKWHFECLISVAAGDYPGIGIANATQSLTTDLGFNTNNSIIQGSTGAVMQNGVNLGSGDSFTNGNTVAVEVDMDAKTIYFQKSGSTRFGPYSIAGTGAMFPVTGVTSGASCTLNTGQAAFAVTPTSGFGAWG